jgi:hypothetical protein
MWNVPPKAATGSKDSSLSFGSLFNRRFTFTCEPSALMAVGTTSLIPVSFSSSTGETLAKTNLPLIYSVSKTSSANPGL